jgi:hypothetical protein
VAETRAAARYLVRADVSLFYPSIYTHSIPWALHGKAFAKANRHDPKLLGNRIDQAIRQGQDQQTVGIPIGPDTSLVIAECVLSAVDWELDRQHPTLVGHRLMDDYEFGCASEPDAERVLADLRAILGNYELQLNAAKTDIVDAPVPLLDSWRAKIQGLRFRTSPSAQHDDLVDYFDEAARLARQHQTSSVLKFAVGRLRFQQLRSENWPLLQYLLFQTILAEPDCIRYAMKELHARAWGGNLPMDRVTLEVVLNRLIERHAPQQSGSEVAWAIWSALVFRVPLSEGTDTYLEAR